jgi:hypothetical protein
MIPSLKIVALILSNQAREFEKPRDCTAEKVSWDGRRFGSGAMIEMWTGFFAIRLDSY